jgi:hypothetical protein
VGPRQRADRAQRHTALLPDTVVTFLNVTDRNCLTQGNIYQRFEYWNFGDYWGAGQDSIIDWTPWPPTFPHTIAYPGIGTYTVTMLDSNYCGIDTAQVVINIVPPPDVTLVIDPDTICAGETAFFNQTTNGGANYFQWNFGEGGGWQWTGPGDQAHAYKQPRHLHHQLCGQHPGCHRRLRRYGQCCSGGVAEPYGTVQPEQRRCLRFAHRLVHQHVHRGDRALLGLR